MKTKTLIAAALLAATIFCGCGESSTTTQTTYVKSINSLGKFPYNSNIDELTVVEIDGCQYIVCNAYSNRDRAITHKGNCKFCKDRSQKADTSKN